MPARLDRIKVHVPEFGVLGGNWVTKLVKEPRIYATNAMKAEFIMKAVEMIFISIILILDIVYSTPTHECINSIRLSSFFTFSICYITRGLFRCHSLYLVMGSDIYQQKLSLNKEGWTTLIFCGCLALYSIFTFCTSDQIHNSQIQGLAIAEAVFTFIVPFICGFMIKSKFDLPEDICLETFDQQISTSNNPYKTIVHENVSLLEPPFISDDPENSRTILTDSPSRFIQDRYTVIVHAIADPENSKTSNDPENSKTQSSQ